MQIKLDLDNGKLPNLDGLAAQDGVHDLHPQETSWEPEAVRSSEVAGCPHPDGGRLDNRSQAHADPTFIQPEVGPQSSSAGLQTKNPPAASICGQHSTLYGGPVEGCQTVSEKGQKPETGTLRVSVQCMPPAGSSGFLETGPSPLTMLLNDSALPDIDPAFLFPDMCDDGQDLCPGFTDANDECDIDFEQQLLDAIRNDPELNVDSDRGLFGTGQDWLGLQLRHQHLQEQLARLQGSQHTAQNDALAADPSDRSQQQLADTAGGETHPKASGGYRLSLINFAIDHNA